MSRLTRRAEEDGTVFYPHCEGCEDFNCINCDFDVEIAKKLAHYEDLEEQGRLIELPCKVGDILYRLVNGEVFEYKVHDLNIDRYDIYPGIVFADDEDAFFGRILSNQIGKDFFLTKAEAERKLEEIQKGEDNA